MTAINLRSPVPCAGCTACCKNELLMLHPEMGDRVEDFDVQPITNPITGRPGFALKQQANGDCTYLGPNGCTIHDRAPAICREFDCRRFIQRLGNRAQVRRLIAQGHIKPDVYEAGRSRMSTLSDEYDHVA